MIKYKKNLLYLYEETLFIYDVFSKERLKMINQKGEPATFELEDPDEDFDWCEDWHNDGKQRKDPENWEYAITWGNQFGDVKEGCFVRRRVFIKRREKSFLN